MGRKEVIGHFGTFGTNITQLLEPIIMRLFDAAILVRFILIGGGSERFRDHLIVKNGESDQISPLLGDFQRWK